MNCCRCLFLAAVIASAGSTAIAQTSPAAAQAAELTAEQVNAARQKRLLPKPLDAIESNIRDLEQEGSLSIVDGRLKIINDGQDQAMVWKVRANRALTCRHIVLQLKYFSDARLYKTLGAETNNPSLQEVHSLRVYYSPRLDDCASGSKLFPRDDLFEIWVYLDTQEIQKIRSLKADRAIFQAPKRR